MHVLAGELLLELDVPDLREAVLQKEAVVVQRQKELAAAEAEQAVAKSAVEAAAAAVKVKGVEVARAQDVLAARQIDLDGVRVLFNRGSAEKFRLDSAELDFRAAQRGVDAARADVAATLSSLSQADLERTYPLEVFDRPMTTAYFLTHLTTHFNYHLGQINYHRRLVANG